MLYHSLEIHHFLERFKLTCDAGMGVLRPLETCRLAKEKLE